MVAQNKWLMQDKFGEIKLYIDWLIWSFLQLCVGLTFLCVNFRLNFVHSVYSKRLVWAHKVDQNGKLLQLQLNWPFFILFVCRLLVLFLWMVCNRRSKKSEKKKKNKKNIRGQGNVSPSLTQYDKDNVWKFDHQIILTNQMTD